MSQDISERLEGLTNSQSNGSGGSLRWGDYLLLVVFCSVLFGYAAVSGRPLTLHEARLPETSREMMAGHNWLIPTDGGRPWLERPPFPHWCMIAVAAVLRQRCDSEWSVRIPPGLAGLAIVIMVSRLAAIWFGRSVGVMSGLMLATMWEFYTYSTLAEDDIFLALLVVGAIYLFARQEFAVDPETADDRIKFLGLRPARVVGFFVLLGLTNLAKGPVVGAAVVIGTIVGYFLMPSLLWQNEELSVVFHFPPKHRRRMRRYFWLWGLLGAAILASSWHLYAAHLFPGPGGYVANLKYDFSETHEFDHGAWYYPVNLIWRGMPWMPLAIAALVITARQAWRERDEALRFLWCWAIVPIVVLSLPHRKGHHYMVPSLAPWGILAAYAAKPMMDWVVTGPLWSRRPQFGLLTVAAPVTVAIVILGWKKLLSPNAAWSAQLESAGILVGLTVGGVWAFYHGMSTRKGRWALAALVLGFGGAWSWAQTHLRDETVPDTLFLRDQVEATVPKDKLLAINAVGSLDFFRVQFYLRPNALMLHNLSYLRSDKIHAVDAYVVAEVKDLPVLKQLGDVQMLSSSTRPQRVNVPELALYHLTFSPGLERYPPPPVSVMQAMIREKGPWCGPELSH